jgi:hypothetical protein
MDAVTNGSAWAVAFHTALALKEGIDPADVQAIREGRLPKDSQVRCAVRPHKDNDRKAWTSRK